MLIFVVRFAMVAMEVVIPYVKFRLAGKVAEDRRRGQVIEALFDS